MSLETFVNADASNLTTARCQSATDLGAIPFKAQAAGDQVVIDLFLTGTSGLESLQDYGSVRLGLGPLNARPESGTYKFDSLGVLLAYNHTAAELETAITTEIAANAVIEVTPFVFKVTFDAVGAQTLPTVDAALLEPASSVNVSRLVTGDGSTQEVWMWRIFRNPIALITDWIDLGDDGLSGVLNLGTTGVYDLLDTNSSVVTFIELELTDSSGNISTVMQQAYTIAGEVIGNGASGVAEFETYATASDLAAKQSLIDTPEGGVEAGTNAAATSGGAIGKDSGATTGFSGGLLAVATQDEGVQLSAGTNATASTIQFLDSGSITARQFGKLASITTSVTATTYTALVTDKYILANNSSGVNVSLAAAATAGDGFELTVKNVNALGVVTVDGDGAETIDGDLTKELTSQYDSFHLVCDGSNWNII